MAHQLNPLSETSAHQDPLTHSEWLEHNFQHVRQQNSYLEDLLKNKVAQFKQFRRNEARLKTELTSLKVILNNTVPTAQYNELCVQNSVIAKNNMTLCKQNEGLLRDIDGLKQQMEKEKRNFSQVQIRYEYLDLLYKQLVKKSLVKLRRRN